MFLAAFKHFFLRFLPSLPPLPPSHFLVPLYHLSLSSFIVSHSLLSPILYRLLSFFSSPSFQSISPSFPPSLLLTLSISLTSLSPLHLFPLPTPSPHFLQTSHPAVLQDNRWTNVVTVISRLVTIYSQDIRVLLWKSVTLLLVCVPLAWFCLGIAVLTLVSATT